MMFRLNLFSLVLSSHTYLSLFNAGATLYTSAQVYKGPDQIINSDPKAGIILNESDMDKSNGLFSASMFHDGENIFQKPVDQDEELDWSHHLHDEGIHDRPTDMTWDEFKNHPNSSDMTHAAISNRLSSMGMDDAVSHVVATNLVQHLSNQNDAHHAHISWLQRLKIASLIIFVLALIYVGFSLFIKFSSCYTMRKEELTFDSVARQLSMQRSADAIRQEYQKAKRLLVNDDVESQVSHPSPYHPQLKSPTSASAPNASSIYPGDQLFSGDHLTHSV